MERVKTCVTCGGEFPESGYDRYKSHGRWVRRGRCKKCFSNRRKEYRKENFAGDIYSKIKGRTPHPPSKDDFLKWYYEQSKVCAYCGLEESKLPILSDTYNGQISRLTIDKKVPESGYILSNMVLACKRCNCMKGNFFTYGEMLEIGKEVAKHWN